jgi:hypothetical protein
VSYVNRVAVPVDDVDRAAAFYEDWFDARVDYPDVNDLDPEITAVIERWADVNEQSEWNKSSSLFMPEQAGLAPEER